MAARELVSGMPHALSASDASSRSNPQDEYYRLKLLEMKFGNDHPLVKGKTEKDEIMVEIGKRIVNVRESTPEWAELVALTGSENRIEQAEYLAEEAWNKRMRELVLRKYTGGKGKVDETFNDSQAKATGLRLAGASEDFLGLAAGDAPAAKAFRKFFGL
jgi:hypothetical protein